MNVHVGSTATPHHGIRSVCNESLRVLKNMRGDGHPGSPRRTEIAAVRTATHAGGTARREILDRLFKESGISVANVGLLAGGVADLFDAGSRRGNLLNVAAATPVLRSAMELTGQMFGCSTPRSTRTNDAAGI